MRGDLFSWWAWQKCWLLPPRSHQAQKDSRTAALWSDLRGSAPAPNMQKNKRNLRTQTNKKLSQMINPLSKALLAIQQGASPH